jgi:hypothetical protein
MRITRDTLIRAARSAVTQRTLYNRRIICIYLTGSLLMEEPLLGGTTDIDLFFIHDSDQPVEREFQKVTDDVHLDIAHLSQSVFHQPRSLRGNPWLGQFLCENPIVLHDQQHWFEYTQAAVCSQFNQPENRLLRARPMAEEARSLWMDLHAGVYDTEASRLWAYLKAIERSGNTIATLTGTPLTERRFFLKLGERAQALGRPALSTGLAELISGEDVTDVVWPTWFEHWSTFLLQAVQGQAASGADAASSIALMQPFRVSYYIRAADAVRSENPPAALWMLLRTWLRTVLALPGASLPPEFQDVVRMLHLDAAHFEERLSGLDAYLDSLEETLEVWVHQNGV